MIPAELSDVVVDAIHDVVADGGPALPIPERVPVTAAGAGRYATPVALRLARTAARPPHELAALLGARIAETPGVADVEVTGPGFLTVTVTAPERLAAHIVEAGESYGCPASGRMVPTGSSPMWPRRPLTFDNPGFSVRFAYARAAAAGRYAAELGVEPEPGPLEDPRERELLGLLAELPDRADLAARSDRPRGLARHLERVAVAYHEVYERCPALPMGDEPAAPRHAARLTLAEAVRIAVGSGLRMLGETPNERM